MTTERICAVVVLYRMRPEESGALCSLTGLLKDEAAAGAAIEVAVCDNSPSEQQMPAGFQGIHWHDSTNPGLAKNYNRGLERAKKTGAGWLMLLDQDTTVTQEYIDEVLQLTQEFADQIDVVAFAPKLVDDRGRGMSPHRPPALRHYAGNLDVTGVAPTRLCAFNSGAVLRVSALETIGGFREDFWLDFLDHATFVQLQRRGGHIYVMSAVLQHELTLRGRDTPGFSVARHRNSVDAECKFYAEFWQCARAPAPEGTARAQRCERRREAW